MAAALLAGCDRSDEPVASWVESWDEDTSYGWAVADDGGYWRSGGEVLWEDEELVVRWDEGPVGADASLFDLALWDGEMLFVADGATALVAFTVVDEVWTTRATLVLRIPALARGILVLGWTPGQTWGRIRGCGWRRSHHAVRSRHDRRGRTV